MFLENGKVPEYADEMRGEFYAAAIKYGGTVLQNMEQAGQEKNTCLFNSVKEKYL